MAIECTPSFSGGVPSGLLLEGAARQGIEDATGGPGGEAHAHGPLPCLQHHQGLAGWAASLLHTCHPHLPFSCLWTCEVFCVMRKLEREVWVSRGN